MAATIAHPAWGSNDLYGYVFASRATHGRQSSLNNKINFGRRIPTTEG